MTRTRTTRPMPRWEPARPIGTRWTRFADSVRLLAAMVGVITRPAA